jgi:hypothetical protein
LTAAAITGFFTLAGSALAGGFAYLQGRGTRQTERARELADARAKLREERRSVFVAVLSAMTRAQDDFVRLQADQGWRGRPAAERLVVVREIRHALQKAVFGALLVVERQDTFLTLAGLNEQVFKTGDHLAAHPEKAPKVVDVGPILIALNSDLNADLPEWHDS